MTDTDYCFVQCVFWGFVHKHRGHCPAVTDRGRYRGWQKSLDLTNFQCSKLVQQLTLRLGFNLM